MSYQYPFVSQLHNDGSGWADCFEACLAAYLLTAKRVDVKEDHEVLLNQVSLAARNAADKADNQYTTIPQAELALQKYGIVVDWDAAYVDALDAYWSICLVNGATIKLIDGTSPYPTAWFNGENIPNHFVLWGPELDGQPNWFMNPLDPDARWKQYDLTSISNSWGGSFLLPNTGSLPISAKWKSKRSFGLLSQPKHGSIALVIVPINATGDDTETRWIDDNGTVWGRFAFGIHGKLYTGWAPVAYVTEISSYTAVYFGVDSSSTINTALPTVFQKLGKTPQFWGRYLNVYSLTADDISYAHDSHIRIVPICNADQTGEAMATGTDIGTVHAQEAITKLKEFNVPSGTLVALDIEAGWKPCGAYLQNWVSEILNKGYIPIAYLNVEDPYQVSVWVKACKTLNAVPYIWSSTPEFTEWANTVKTDWFSFSTPHVVIHQYSEGDLNDLIDMNLCLDAAIALMWKP